MADLLKLVDMQSIMNWTKHPIGMIVAAGYIAMLR